MKAQTRAFCLFLTMLLILPQLPAAADTITGLAVDFDPTHPELISCYAQITGYDPAINALTVEVIVPEAFDGEEVRTLRVGDAIYTGGGEVAIRTISETDGFIVLNAEDDAFSEGSVWLSENADGSYSPMVYDDFVWLACAALSMPVSDHLLFLDGIDPTTGEPRDLPAVYTAAAFLQILAGETDGTLSGPGFAAHNVSVVFDQDGQLALIRRFYVPWQ